VLPELEHRTGFAELKADPLYESLVVKLDPAHISLSGKMTAIVACILGQEWSNPRMAWLSIDSQGNVVSDADFIGSADDLDRNLAGVLDTAEVTPSERVLFERLRANGIDDHRREVTGPEPSV
jgi:hypothetical protein